LEFFADRNLGVHVFPAIVRAEGVTVHLHQDHFPQDAADVEWLPEAARRGWIIISPDIRISRDQLEVEAIMTSGAAVFCLAATLPGSRRRATFSVACRRSPRCWSGRPRPFIAKVYQPNRDDPADTTTRRVEVKLTLADWERRRRR
jgi:hypothetical protein